MRKISIATLLLLITTTLGSAQSILSGVVFLDNNGNGVRDRHEAIISGLPVSNGDTIVYTDNKGRYSIQLDKDEAIFPILSLGQTTSLNGAIQNYRPNLPLVKGAKLRKDIAILHSQDSLMTETFSMAAVGDVQVDDITQLGYAQRSIFAELEKNGNISFSVLLGDLVNDKPWLLNLSRQLVDSLPKPCWIVVGNHDLDKKSEVPTASFHREIGSDIFAFVRGNVVFVGLNNMENFSGYMPERAIRFLRNLKPIYEGKLLVLMFHVPLTSVDNRNELLGLFDSDQRVLILSAHAHNVSRKIWSSNIEEFDCGASCGSWWLGEVNHQGVPYATMQCGSPRNYYLFHFNQDGTYTAEFKAVGESEQYQFNIWGASGEYEVKIYDPVLFPDGKIFKKECYQSSLVPADGKIKVNLFAGGDSTQIWVRKVGSQEWQPLKRTFDQIDIKVQELREAYYSPKYVRRDLRKIPLRKRPSPHIWSQE